MKVLDLKGIFALCFAFALYATKRYYKMYKILSELYVEYNGIL